MSELPNVLRALASLTLAIFRPTSSDSQAKGLGRNQRSWDFLPVLRQDLAFGFRLQREPVFRAAPVLHVVAHRGIEGNGLFRFAQTSAC